MLVGTFLVPQTSKAPAKRSQHVPTTYLNIVGRNMLRAFDNHVAMCCDMLGIVGSSLKMVKFGPTTPNMSSYLCQKCKKKIGGHQLRFRDKSYGKLP